MRLPARVMRWAGIFATGILVAVIPATAGLTTPSQLNLTAAINARTADHSNSDMTSALPDQAYDNCLDGAYCDYNGTNGKDKCFTETIGAPINWSAACRNHDESFANHNIGGLVRLYYSPDLKGAWACVNNGWYSNNLNKDVYTFNNGSGPGHGQEIWKNIASSEALTGGCRHPLPEDG